MFISNGHTIINSNDVRLMQILSNEIRLYINADKFIIIPFGDKDKQEIIREITWRIYSHVLWAEISPQLHVRIDKIQHAYADGFRLTLDMDTGTIELYHDDVSAIMQKLIHETDAFVV